MSLAPATELGPRPSALAIPRYTLALTAAIVLAAVGAIHAFAPRSLPSDPESRLERLLEAGLTQPATTLLESMLDGNPADPDLNYRYATQLLRARRGEDREAVAARLSSRYGALASRPGAEGDEGRYVLGLIDSIDERWDGALSHFAGVVNKDLKYLNNSEGLAWFRKGDASRAETCYRREIELGGNVQGAVSNLLELTLGRGEVEKADALARDARTSSFVGNDARRTIALRSGRVFEYLWRTFLRPLRVSFGGALSALFICSLWFFFLWRIDVFKQEPWHAVFFALGAGAISAPGTGLLHDLVTAVLPVAPGSLTYFCVVVGLVEETAKLIPVLLIAAFTGEIDEPVDLLVYGSLSALGFATLENALYFTGYGEGIVFTRFLVSTVIHLSLTSIICYTWASARWIRPRRIVPSVLAGLAVASVMHGVFDWASFTPHLGMSLISIVILIVIAGVYGHMLVNTLDFSPYYDTSFATSSRLHNYQLLATGAIVALFIVFLHDHVRFSTEIADRRSLQIVTATWLPMAAVFGGLGELGLQKRVLVPLLPGRFGSIAAFLFKKPGERG